MLRIFVRLKEIAKGLHKLAQASIPFVRINSPNSYHLAIIDWREIKNISLLSCWEKFLYKLEPSFYKYICQLLKSEIF